MIFEFTLAQGREDKMEATDLSLTISYASQGNW